MKYTIKLSVFAIALATNVVVAQPRQISSIPLTNAVSITVQSSEAFLLSDDVMTTYDISTPTHPLIMGTLSIGPSSPGAVRVNGDHAYLACIDGWHGNQWQGVKCYDITDRSSPAWLSSVTVGEEIDPDVLSVGNDLVAFGQNWADMLYDFTVKGSPEEASPPLVRNHYYLNEDLCVIPNGTGLTLFRFSGGIFSEIDTLELSSLYYEVNQRNNRLYVTKGHQLFVVEFDGSGLHVISTNVRDFSFGTNVQVADGKAFFIYDEVLYSCGLDDFTWNNSDLIALGVNDYTVADGLLLIATEDSFLTYLIDESGGFLVPELAEAMDESDIAWTTGGDLWWFKQDERYAQSHDGRDAAQSGGQLRVGQESWMKTTILGPGTFSFWWKVYSQLGSSYLEFYIDGELQGEGISGTGEDWQMKTHHISAGEHVLKFSYTENYWPGKGWVDWVSFIQDVPVDIDTDGLADAWELQHFNNLTISDGTRDSDGDGISDGDEYTCGTLPTNATSVLHAELSKTARGFVVDWSAAEDRYYDVLWTPTLTNQVQPITTGLTYPINSYTDTVHAVDSSGYYRIRAAFGTATAPAGMVRIPRGINNGTGPSGYKYTTVLDSAIFMDSKEISKSIWDDVYAWAVNNGYDFTNAGGSKGPLHPVSGINWYDCVKWCNARSESEGLNPCYSVSEETYREGEEEPDCDFTANGYRLPTFFEWSYAARGGLAGKRFPWGDQITHSNANYRANGSSYDYDVSPYTVDTYHPDYDSAPSPYTSPVGSFPPNGYGLYDIAGNVAEWTNYASNDRKVAVGGAYSYSAAGLRLTGSSVVFDPDRSDIARGFRTVRK